MEQELDVLVIHAPQPIFYPICVPLLKGGHLLETGFPSCGRWRNYWGASNSSCSLAPPFMLLCCKLNWWLPFKRSLPAPGGNKEEYCSKPALKQRPMLLCIWNFISSCSLLLSDLCSNISFSPFSPLGTKGKAFGRDLPRKLLLGLTSLFISIAAMLFTLCTGGHFFLLIDEVKYAAIPVYAVACLPVTFFAMVQFPFYFDLIWKIYKEVSQCSY